jgi:curved DNA-binding protein CbpA
MGVALTATSEEVRAAYVRLVREHPPDRDPETFEAVRDAYEALRDPDRRAALGVLSGNPDAPLVSLLDDEPKQRRFVGPAPWLATLGKRG